VYRHRIIKEKDECDAMLSLANAWHEIKTLLIFTRAIALVVGKKRSHKMKTMAGTRWNLISKEKAAVRRSR
jgi:hypothetical protein